MVFLSNSSHSRHHTPNFDPSQYPRTYRPSPGWRVFFITTGAIVVGISLLAGVDFARTSSGQSLATALVCFSGLCSLGIYTILWTVRFRVVLYPDSIEIQDVLSSRVLRRTDIVGRRVLPTRYVSTLLLVPSQGGKKLKISEVLQTDSAFQVWLAAIPDLDLKDRRNVEARIETDPELGLTPGDRAFRLQKAKKVSKVMNVVSLAAVFWGLWYPRPYQLVIAVLAVLPLVAIFLTSISKGIYQVEGRRNDPRPTLALVFICPGLILALRFFQDLQLVRWTQILAPSIVIGAVLTFLAVRSDFAVQKRPWAIAPTLLFLVVYGCGVVTQANALLDRSQPQLFEANVLAKHFSTGRSTTWYLTTGPWGAKQNGGDISVSRSLYYASAPGQTVCFRLFPGALTIPWYFVSACR